MTKNLESSKKIRVSISADDKIISLKSQSQPLTRHEQVSLNQIYNESLIRLRRIIELLNNLEFYFFSKENSGDVINIKQQMIDENVNPNLLHTLKMLKRHFYIDITFNSISNMLSYIERLKKNVLISLKGLEGHLDITLQLCMSEPSETFINENFKPKTYLLIYNHGEISISYYEDKVKIKDIPVSHIDSEIYFIDSYQTLHDNKSLIFKKIASYHAHQEDSKIDNIYICNISLKRQNNKDNNIIGYVHRNNGQHFGAIHIDYRLLKSNPYLAMMTLLHESFHRFADVNDRSYYHGNKYVKSTGYYRSYPVELQQDTQRAFDNAATYEYFVCDTTGHELYYLLAARPDWYESIKLKNTQKPLPENLVQEKSFLNKFTIFGLTITAAIATGSAFYVMKHRRDP